MKLFHSPTSPYVRKVMVTAIEKGLDGRIARVAAAAHPINQDQTIAPHNPLAKVPTLILDDGSVLFDSPVICEYLDSLAPAPALFPARGTARWQALALQALADGVLDAAVGTRYETFVRPKEFRWQPWVDGQLAKVKTALGAIEASAGTFGDRLDIGTIAVACALGYLDFRYALLDWRATRPQAAKWFSRFGERRSMRETVPKDPA